MTRLASILLLLCVGCATRQAAVDLSPPMPPVLSAARPAVADAVVEAIILPPPQRALSWTPGNMESAVIVYHATDVRGPWTVLVVTNQPPVPMQPALDMEFFKARWTNETTHQGGWM